MRNTTKRPRAGRTGRNRLRNDIVGGALVVTFSLLFLFAGFTYWQGHAILTGEALKSLEAVASVQEARLQTYVEGGLADLELVVERPALINGLQGYSGSADPAFLEDIAWIANAAQQAAAGTDAVYVFDSDLALISAAPPAGPQFDVPADLLDSALRGPTSGPIVRAEDGTYVHLLGGPVQSDGSVVGVVVVARAAEPLFDVAMDHIGLGETGETIIAASTPPNGPVYIAPLRFAPAAVLRPVPGHIEALPMTQAVSGAEIADAHGVDYRGHDVFAVTRYLDGPGWGLVVKKDRSEVLAPLDEFAVFALGVLSVALVLAYFLTDRFTEATLKPVRKVTRMAKAIAAGRRDLTVDSDRTDEIGELALAFDEMSMQLNTLTAELEGRVADRTRELEEKNAELAKLMEEKETFLAGVSHEVRSPLTAMIGFLDLVNDAGESLSIDERTEMLETVSRQADDVLNLIEDLLASARVEAGTLKVVSVRCNLGAQARQVVESIAASTRVDISVRGDGAVADADPARVRQIVRNLLTNADRYGGQNVVIEVTSANGVAVLSVRDDGPGVPESDREEIFQAYGQAASNRIVDGSVGLGLHVSRELARLMGGDLGYEYVDGWSVFSLFLPEHYDEDAPEQAPAAAGVMAAG